MGSLPIGARGAGGGGDEVCDEVGDEVGDEIGGA